MSLFIPYYVSKKERINKLVFSGGSTKGISYIGIIKGLEENNLFKNIKTFAGTSIGAIFSFLLTIGYDYYSLNDIVKSINIEKLCKINKMSSYGFDDEVNLVSMIKELMDKKNIKHDITFKELFKLTNKRLIITVTNLTLKKAEYLDYKRTPDMNVLIGLRMSFSVPIVFKPIIYNGCYYVDGGLVDNLPVGIYVKQIQSNSPASTSDIKTGDVITEIDGTEISSMNELNKIKEQKNIGDKVTLTLYRGGETKKVEITLGETP